MPKSKAQKRVDAEERSEYLQEMTLENRIKMVIERNSEKGGNSERELARLERLIQERDNPNKNVKKNVKKKEKKNNAKSEV